MYIKNGKRAITADVVAIKKKIMKILWTSRKIGLTKTDSEEIENH